MYLMKRLCIIFLIFMNFSLFSRTKLPFTIETQENIFRKIASDISLKLPQEVDILIFKLMFVNADKALDDRINKNFELIMKSQQFIYKYTTDFIDDVLKDPKYKDFSEDYSFIDNYDEQELLSFARYLNKDAILIGTVMILDETKKGVWDGNLKKFTDKKVALLQGTIFYTDTGETLMRFSYYFLVD